MWIIGKLHYSLQIERQDIPSHQSHQRGAKPVFPLGNTDSSRPRKTLPMLLEVVGVMQIETLMSL